ncbi:MAG: 4'-phosphopantetheinyl transferase superfamily protein [Lachnospiraceae bacterium]|nr:4'-phosphopantetheinyl transferase superfamily protein [Lachnospiraceae bacterium]
MIKVMVKKIEWNKLEREFETLGESLYPARREAVERLNNKKAKLSSMATGLLLQELVRAELGVEPKELVIGRGSQGKPYVEGHPEFHFNISHSGDMVAIAYGACQVGVDVEHIRCRENDLKVAKRCFTPEEYTFITDEAFAVDLEGVSHSVEERFFMVWTMKEAYLKYKGTGISVPMNSFQVKPYEGIVVGEKLSCQSVIINDYVYSVCVDGGAQVDISFE